MSGWQLWKNAFDLSWLRLLLLQHTENSPPWGSALDLYSDNRPFCCFCYYLQVFTVASVRGMKNSQVKGSNTGYSFNFPFLVLLHCPSSPLISWPVGKIALYCQKSSSLLFRDQTLRECCWSSYDCMHQAVYQDSLWKGRHVTSLVHIFLGITERNGSACNHVIQIIWSYFGDGCRSSG